MRIGYRGRAMITGSGPLEGSDSNEDFLNTDRNDLVHGPLIGIRGVFGRKAIAR